MRNDLLVLRLESQPEFIPVRGGFDRVMVCNNNAILLKFLAQIVALVVPTVVKKINIISLHLVHYFAIHTLFPNGDTVKPRKIVQDIVRKSGLKAQSKLKPNETAIKYAVKHIYSKLLKYNRK